MLIAALFTIAKLWKQPRCSTTDKWIKKMWYLYTMGFYSVTKKNEILSFTGKWMKLENIILSEVLRKPRATCSPSYTDCRPKTNAAILWDMGHTKRRLCKGGRGQGKETENMNVVDVLTLQDCIQKCLTGWGHHGKDTREQ
jgi:hypothetical protein